MTKEFVFLTEADFIQWANNTFGANNFQVTTPKYGRELVIRHDFNIHGLEYHCYTTVEPSNSKSRDKGEDAIRSILYDRNGGRIAHQEPKILRVEGTSSVFDRLTERFNNIKNIALACQKKDRFCKCPSNRVHTLKRVKKSDGSVFYGCAIWELCHKAGFNKLEHARNQYPLTLSPFVDPKPVQTEQPLTHTPVNHTRSVQTDYTTWEVNPDTELTPTKNWTLAKYPFDYFNVVQSTVYNSQVWNRDCNLILGTATSSGKTICAEMAIAQILYGK